MIMGIAVMLIVFGSLQARAAVTTNDVIPFEMTVHVDCALGGAGEDVELTGELHVLIVTTVSKSGMQHTELHFQPINVSGVGETSGDKYRAVGITRTDMTIDTSDGFPQETTAVNNFYIIGQGPGNNFMVHETFHVTINANGEVTADIDKLIIECR